MSETGVGEEINEVEEGRCREMFLWRVIRRTDTEKLLRLLAFGQPFLDLGANFAC